MFLWISYEINPADPLVLFIFYGIPWNACNTYLENCLACGEKCGNSDLILNHVAKSDSQLLDGNSLSQESFFMRIITYLNISLQKVS